MKWTNIFGLGLAAVLVLGSASAHAQQAGVLRVRLVTASNDEGTAGPGLEDVLPLLKKNLRFASYRLVSEKRAALTNGLTMSLGLGYHLTVDEVAGQTLTVQVNRQTTKLVRTRLLLQPDRPVILGGFQHGENKTLIVIVNLVRD